MPQTDIDQLAGDSRIWIFPISPSLDASKRAGMLSQVDEFLRGWAAFFRYGNSAWAFDKIRSYALMRLALFVAKQHKRKRSWGVSMLYRSPDNLGLVSLNGIVVAPRPNRAWRAPAEHRR